jgi:hypothetical protein
MSKANNEIVCELVRTNVYTRWPCTVCGGCTEKVSVLTEAKDTINGGEDILVCERCLERGDIDGELSRHADRLEEHARVYAQELRRLIGHLRVPTFERWQTEDRFQDHAHFVLPIFEAAEASGRPIETKEQLIQLMQAHPYYGEDADFLVASADRYREAWRSKWKAEYEKECEDQARRASEPEPFFGDELPF